MNDKLNDKLNRNFLIASGLILLAAFCGCLWFLDARLTCLLNSDDSSELILGRLLSSENSLLSSGWYYSTELRVLNTQIFYALFFKFFDSWHAVRMASAVCLFGVLLAAYYFACRGLKIKKYFLLTAALLLMPFSSCYFDFVLKVSYYIPHIAITFFTIGLGEGFVAEDSKRKQKLYLAAAFFSAVLAAMGGPRQLIVLYVPLTLAAFALLALASSVVNGKITCTMRPGDKRFLLFAGVSFAGAGIGYCINSFVLARLYSFTQWNYNISFVGFDFSKLAEIFNSFLLSCGYSCGLLLSEALLCNFLCLCWMAFTVYACLHTIKNRAEADGAQYRMALFTTAAFVFFTLLCLLTDLSYSDRYTLPVIVLSLPMTVVLLKNASLADKVKQAAAMIFVLLSAVSACLFYAGEYRTDETAELRSIADLLQKEHCSEGYATFWRANILTELSDGAIEVWTWQDSREDQHITVSGIDETYKWLQLKSHDKTHPKGRVFLLFTKTELENCPWADKLGAGQVLYQSDEYVVLGFESYDRLCGETAKPQQAPCPRFPLP